MLVEILLSLILWIFLLHIKKRSKLPGGPFSLPIIGTVDLLNGGNPIKQFFIEKHNKQYADFCSFFLGPSKVLIVINDFKICKELFAKAKFSGNIINVLLHFHM